MYSWENKNNMYSWEDIENAVTMTNEGFNIANIKKFLNNEIDEAVEHPDVILNIICKYYGVHPLKVKGRDRERKYVIARKMFAYFACIKNGMIQEDVAFILRKQRTVLVHYIKSIHDYLSINDEETIKDVENIEKLLIKKSV